jgi:hypothetical protein
LDSNFVPNPSVLHEVHLSLSPWFITGFADAEGCFSIGVTRSKTRLGWRVKLEFIIGALNNPANRQ